MNGKTQQPVGSPKIYEHGIKFRYIGPLDQNERLVYGWRKILKNITRGYGHHEPGVINLIFSQVMTITTSDIFQYFCQPYNNYIHKFVVK